MTFPNERMSWSFLLVVSQQALDPRDVEHGVGLQERNLALDVVTVRIGFLHQPIRR